MFGAYDLRSTKVRSCSQLSYDISSTELAGPVRHCPDVVDFTSVHSHHFMMCAGCTHLPDTPYTYTVTHNVYSTK